MINIEKGNELFFDSCQLCHTKVDIHSIKLSDGRFGVKLYLCKKCCKKLLKEIDKYLKNVDKIN